MIPKIFHFVLGLKVPEGCQQVSPVYDFDFMCYLSVKSKLVKYPDYEVWLWNNPEQDLSSNEWYNKILSEDNENRIKIMDLSAIKSPDEEQMDYWWITRARFSIAYLADYYRFHILLQYGGVYSDTDSISLRKYPFDEVQGFAICQEADNKSEYPLLNKLAGIHFFGAEQNSRFLIDFLKERYLDENYELNNVALAYKVATKLESEISDRVSGLIPTECFIPVPIGLEYQMLLFETNKIDWHKFNYELHLYNSACSRNGFKDKCLSPDAIMNGSDTSFNRAVRDLIHIL